MEERVLVDCPVCAQEEEHLVLKATVQTLTVQCTECGKTHSMSPPRMRTADLGLVVSDGDRSWTDRIETPSDETIQVGDEFEHADHRMMVTAIEASDHRHVPKANASDIHTVFAKLFDTVDLKISVNEGDVTKSYVQRVTPERRVEIGEVLDVDGRRLAVKTLKSDQNRTLHRGFLLARNIRRVFCDPAPTHARRGSRLPTRPRGDPEKSKGRKPRK